jgi:hypothetical protein
VEQFKDVFELLFLHMKAHCPFDCLEQSFSWFERQTPLSHTPFAPQSMELSFLKTLGSLYYNVHLQHVCLHIVIKATHKLGEMILVMCFMLKQCPYLVNVAPLNILGT